MRSAPPYPVRCRRPTADTLAVGDLVGALLALEPTDTDRANAGHAILDALPTADPLAVGHMVGCLVGALPILAPVFEWLGLLSVPTPRR